MRGMGSFGSGGGRIVGMGISVLKWPSFGLVRNITLFLKSMQKEERDFTY